VGTSDIENEIIAAGDKAIWGWADVEYSKQVDCFGTRIFCKHSTSLVVG
jgi:hypothetical protein